MNKTELLQLNVIPEGQAAWLSYDQFLRLKHLFETLPLPTSQESTDDLRYIDLYHFLTEVAELNLPCNEATIHFNAFALIRRGYRVETLTATEYRQLGRLMENLEQPTIDDLDLYDTGGHRELYTYLTQDLGLSVQPGRGPAWHRAKALRENYEADQIG